MTEADISSLDYINKKAKNAVAWIGTTTIVRQILLWGLTLYTARVLTPTDYGIAALPGTLLPYLILIATLKLDTWVIQEKDLTAHRQASVFSLMLSLSFLMTVLSYFLAPSFATFYSDSSLTLMFEVCSVIFLLHGLQVLPECLLRKELSFKNLSLVDMVIPLLQGILTLVLALSGYGYWSLILGILFRYTLRCVVLYMMHPVSLTFTWDSEVNRKAIKFGLHAAGATALWVIFSTTDDIVIGRLFSKEQLGFYTMAFLLSQLPISKLQMVIGQLLIPYYSKLKSNNHETIQPFLRVTRVIVSLVVPALAGLAIVAPEAIAIVLGEHWLLMVEPLRVLCLVAILQSFAASCGALFSAIGRPDGEFKSSIVGALILPAGFILGGYYFGMRGVYLAWLALYPIVLIYSLKILRDITSISLSSFFANLKAPLICTLLMSIGVLAVRNVFIDDLSQIILLTAGILTGLTIYVLSFFLMFRKESFELLNLRSIVSRKAS